MTDEDDLELDFTKPPPKPAPPPPPERVEKAKQEAVASRPELVRTGFYVAMARRPSEKVLPRNGNRHSVLVVEDDSDLLKLVIEVLGKAGFLTRSAKNRTEINAEFNKTPLPDLVLLDV